MDNRIEAFLALRDFDEYMERFETFAGLPVEKEVFKKEMALMDTDASYTHRQKDALRQRRKREIIKRLQAEIDALCDAINADGPHITTDESLRSAVEILYRYPDGKQGDIAHTVARMSAIDIDTEGHFCQAVFTGNAYREIELILLPVKNLFNGYDFSQAEETPGTSFLLKYNRVFQLEYLMWKVNCFTQEYRSLRSIKNVKLRELLKAQFDRVFAERDAIYEELICGESTNAKWVSEQKAYAIVKIKYPEARFQYRAEWLCGQRLDIYIPTLKAAIEYQGRQHTESIDFFGGSQGLLNNRERDYRKKRACEAHGITLVYWNYDQPLTMDFFTEHIEPQLVIKSESAI